MTETVDPAGPADGAGFIPDGADAPFRWAVLRRLNSFLAEERAREHHKASILADSVERVRAIERLQRAVGDGSGVGPFAGRLVRVLERPAMERRPSGEISEEIRKLAVDIAAEARRRVDGADWNVIIAQREREREFLRNLNEGSNQRPTS